MKKHLEALLELEQRVVEGVEAQRTAELDRVGEHERLELEESLRRLARSLHGGLTHKRRVASRGRVDSGRTMRRNMRFDGVPFAPVTVRRAEDKPRLIVLTDVSLSVRPPPGSPCTWCTGCRTCSARCGRSPSSPTWWRSPTCSPTTRWRTRWGWCSAGRCSTWTPTPTTARRSRTSWRSTDRRSTGAPPCSCWATAGATATTPRCAFEEICRRARETIWLTPEPRYSWALGGCDLPLYAEHCSRVRVVRDLTGLDTATHEMAVELVGR